MTKRILSATPHEMNAWSGRELLSAIRMSEGRVLRAAARIRSGNLIDGVCNAETAAAFGADFINLDTYDLLDPSIPGWNSKKAEEDQPFQDVQIPRGKGYSFRELEEIVGRPISILLLAAKDDRQAELAKRAYGNIVLSKEVLKKACEENVRWLQIDSFDERVDLSKKISEIRQIVGNDKILHVAKSHGAGILNMENSRSLINEDEIIALLNAGADIVGFPAPGSYPGWDISLCKKMTELVHRHGGIVSLGIHTSQEVANAATLEQIALYAKMCGTDMHDLGDCGFNENMIDPMNILRYGVAIRGKRHQYRRMSISQMR